jgi:hypothetical protein
LSYDKLSQLAERLQIDIAELFETRAGSAVANARRSVDRLADAPRGSAAAREATTIIICAPTCVKNA